MTNLDSGAGRDFLNRCRCVYSQEGALALPGFLDAEVLPELIAEAEAGAVQSRPFCHHFQFGTGTSTESYDLESLPGDDPRRFLSRTSLTFVGEHLIPTNSFLRRLHHWPPLLDFIAKILELPALYRRCDGLSGINYTVMGEGDEQSWHFDEAHFITSILLRPAIKGGQFEYVRGLRDDEGDDLE
ncbi:MAG: hypothetical protein R3245_06295, partial [Kiloniellales bacterium]|nr:hypothetical protein [Kiloniellales bacterium]